MPNNKEHCEDSLRRYGKTFEELHRWMDEPSAIMGASHRRVRHDPYTTPQEAKKLFGENADHACLDHIRLDELDSRKKGFRKTLKPRVSPSFTFGFLSFWFFICGIFFAYLQSAWNKAYNNSWILSVGFFAVAFFFFLASVGSSGKSTREETPTFSYPITKPPNWEKTENKITWEQITIRCPKCGANYSSQNEKCPFCENVVQKKCEK